jgi:hypothetical protein
VNKNMLYTIFDDKSICIVLNKAESTDVYKENIVSNESKSVLLMSKILDSIRIAEPYVRHEDYCMLAISQIDKTKLAIISINTDSIKNYQKNEKYDIGEDEKFEGDEEDEDEDEDEEDEDEDEDEEDFEDGTGTLDENIASQYIHTLIDKSLDINKSGLSTGYVLCNKDWVKKIMLQKYSPANIEEWTTDLKSPAWSNNSIGIIVVPNIEKTGRSILSIDGSNDIINPKTTSVKHFFTVSDRLYKLAKASDFLNIISIIPDIYDYYLMENADGWYLKIMGVPPNSIVPVEDWAENISFPDETTGKLICTKDQAKKFFK